MHITDVLNSRHCPAAPKFRSTFPALRKREARNNIKRDRILPAPSYWSYHGFLQIYFFRNRKRVIILAYVTNQTKVGEIHVPVEV